MLRRMIREQSKKRKNIIVIIHIIAIIGAKKGNTRFMCGNDPPDVGWIEVLRRDRRFRVAGNESIFTDRSNHTKANRG